MSKNKDGDKNIMTFKVITLGDSFVGKTSIIKRFITGKFKPKFINTIGYSVSSKNIILKNGTEICLNLIDTAGQEKYQALAKTYIKNSDAVLFVFSYDNEESFNNIKKWLDNFRENNNNFDSNKSFPAYLVGNKCDLNHVIKQEDIEEIKEENNIYGIMETSAKDNININDLFNEIGEMLFNIYGNRKKGQNVKLAVEFTKQKKGCNYCLTEV